MATSRSLSQFGRRFDLRAKQVRGGTAEIVQRAAFVTDQVAVLATPVKTGFARAGWFLSIGTPSKEMPFTGSGAAAQSLARAQAVIPTWKVGDPPIFITNNVEYINELDQGSSNQAPLGMSSAAVLAGLAVLRQGKVFRG